MLRPSAYKLAALLAAAVLVAVAVVLAVRGRGSGDAGPSIARVPVPGAPDFPAPPRGAVVFSRQLGPDALALGVVPRDGGVLVQASVLGPQGKGVPGLDVRFEVGGASAGARPCGAGCYVATLETGGAPRAVEVEVRGAPVAVGWHVALPTAWPPPDATGRLARAERVWRSLSSLAFSERIASDLRHVVTSTWRVAAPGSVAYQVDDGWAGIVIGARRWDRPPGGTWTSSEQTRLTQPVPPWVSAADARLLGAATVHGRPAWLISFFDPGTPAWFSVALERQTFRTLELHMTTTAHFMHDVYRSFNEAAPIVPPR